MNIQKQVKARVIRLKSGRVITYSDFKAFQQASPSSLSRALSKLVSEGILIRKGKGVFYKPERTLFGVLEVSEKEILKRLMMKNGKYSGYLSGQYVFLKYNISTQVPNQITIASSKSYQVIDDEKLKIKYIKSRVNNIYKDDIGYLQLLDALRFAKLVQDATVDDVVYKIKSMISKYNINKIKRLYQLSLKYNPSTMALVGAILEDMGYLTISKRISSKLNKLTTYNIGVGENILPNKKDWRIK